MEGQLDTPLKVVGLLIRTPHDKLTKICKKMLTAYQVFRVLDSKLWAQLDSFAVLPWVKLGDYL